MAPEWTTAVNVPEDHPARSMPVPCPGELHVAVWQPNDDTGGERHSVVVTLPEYRHALNEALKDTAFLDARLLLVADTPQQIDEAADCVERALPGHRRMPLERAVAGAYGPAT